VLFRHLCQNGAPTNRVQNAGDLAAFFTAPN